MKKVLFVCIKNSGRSQMAEAFFNQASYATMEALSAGTDPAKQINPIIVKVMQEAGIDISKNRPKMINENMLSDADVIITMGCGVTCPCLARRKTVNWGLTDPEGKGLLEIREIRDRIKAKVTELISELNITSNRRKLMVKVKVFGTTPPCAKCKEMEKRAQNVAAKFSGDVEIAKLDALSEESDRYGVMSTPTTVVNEKVVAIGKLITEEELKKIIKKEMEAMP